MAEDIRNGTGIAGESAKNDRCEEMKFLTNVKAYACQYALLILLAIVVLGFIGLTMLPGFTEALNG